ncbi:WD repeat-containing protein 47-like isoform X2 [Acanthaster planci]|uniref:WD repeat-containing protein 47-like isoform X2 n=1 Tax=Acanthaster planci TaxID=133434 RepID=A0A8B7Y703_ACAPL|nr:WD repeat-containing protein 47-like isoform X2 [Acanthaster planci]
MPSSVKVIVKEPDVLKLVLDFLSSRELYMSMRSLERESGVVNGLFSDDALFLRNLILDGQWDDVLEFIQPLESIESFDIKSFRFLVLKHKFLEMLCMKDEDLQHLQMEFSIDEVVSCLNELEPYCPTKEDYSNLCLLLTLPRLTDHAAYKNWSPSNARVQCFQDVYPLVARFLPADKNLESSDHTASKDRLIQLLIKGLVFESCVDFCQQRATAKDVQYSTLQGMLTGSDADDADLSLLSWLQSIPPATFSCPFEQKSLEVAVERISKPSASWSEQIMTPMTPTPSSKQRGYPSPSPTTPILYRNRPWSAGSSRGLSQSLTPTLEAVLLSQGKKKEDSPGQEVNMMSRSMGNVHLSGGMPATMNTSTLAPVAEDVERPPSQSMILKSPQKTGNKTLPTTQPVTQLSQNPGSSNADAYAEFLASKKLFQQDLERQEKHRQQLQELLQSEGAAGDAPRLHRNMGSGDSLSSQSKFSPDAVSMNDKGSQPHHPANVHSSTPKTNRFDPTVTPDPGASPVLAKHTVPHSYTYNSRHDSTEEGTSIDPVHRLEASLGEVLAPGGNLMNVTYLSPSLSHLKENSDATSEHGMENRLPVQEAESNRPKLLKEKITGSSSRMLRDSDRKAPRYVAVTTLEDVQAIRAVTFDPTGSLYAVGANSKTLRICSYPDVSHVTEDETKQPTVLFKRTRHHKGSIYCVGWSPSGNLIATGSNDKFIKLLRFDPQKCNADGPDIDMTMHDGTVRDLVFQPESSHGTVLVSGGAGDCSIFVTDCNQAQTIHAMAGHSGHVLSLYCWGAHMLVSGSQDNTVRLWDLRTPRCVQVIGTPGSDSGQGTAAATVCVDPSGRLLASGHEDSSCLLYDIHGGRIVQTYKKHKGEVRSLRFSPKALYLMSGSYDGTVLISDLQGDLTKTLPSTLGAKHNDKVIQCRWHPTDFTFLSSSADRTVTLWAPLHQ